jgi:hypothetical protein
MHAKRGHVTNTHIIGGLVLGYLAMVAEFGYIIALMRSGLLMREQFFNSRKFHPSLALRHQMLFGGTMPTAPEERIGQIRFHSHSRTGPAPLVLGILP